jgi:hypothetical protein
MAGLGDDARIVAAAGEHEGDLCVGQKMDLVHRAPGRYVIALGADREDRDPDVGEGDGSPIDLVAPCGQVIIEEQMAKIL